MMKGLHTEAPLHSPAEPHPPVIHTKTAAVSDPLGQHIHQLSATKISRSTVHGAKDDPARS